MPVLRADPDRKWRYQRRSLLLSVAFGGAGVVMTHVPPGSGTFWLAGAAGLFAFVAGVVAQRRATRNYVCPACGGL